MTVRIVILVLLASTVMALALRYRAGREADIRRGAVGLPRLPEWLRAPSGRTWVVFTTPWCTSCEAVEADLQARFPDDTVVRVDAVEHPELTQRYDVRRAPTVLAAGPDGAVSTRAVGLDGVRQTLGA
jgi:hypothetical protein